MVEMMVNKLVKDELMMLTLGRSRLPAGDDELMMVTYGYFLKVVAKLTIGEAMQRIGNQYCNGSKHRTGA